MKGDPLQLTAVFRDGTTKIIEVQEQAGLETLTYYKYAEVVHKADVIVCINLKSGLTKVLKNRYGDTGTVTP